MLVGLCFISWVEITLKFIIFKYRSKILDMHAYLCKRHKWKINFENYKKNPQKWLINKLLKIPHANLSTQPNLIISSLNHSVHSSLSQILNNLVERRKNSLWHFLSTRNIIIIIFNYLPSLWVNNSKKMRQNKIFYSNTHIRWLNDGGGG
jgi:hypothetical protein